jgi:asparagine synthase (glutamine-hydrolysing)
MSPVSAELLHRMLTVIAHRGPDDEGLYIEPYIALGVRRLSIIDLEGGHQPIYNEDGTLLIVFNGEIYNYPDLKETLRQRHHLATAADTEVILHLYEDFGMDCVQHLRGMFAFAIWDMRRRRLLIARDRLGVKPLYYADRGGQLTFASEIKAILQESGIQPRLNRTALSHFLALKYVPAPETIFEGIQALPPGCLLVCDERGCKVQRYWDVGFVDVPPNRLTEGAYMEQLEHLLSESVRMELMSDVPFGAFLSGGIDSSTIVALMSQFLNEPVKTFSVGFAGKGMSVSELPYARMVAEQYSTDHHEVEIDAHNFVELMPKIIWHLDQPIADPAAIPNYMVAELASRSVKMVLTGEGGDELFAGYARYTGERFSPIFRQIPRPVRSMLITLASAIPQLRRPKIALYALCQTDTVHRMVNWFALFNTDMRAELMSASFNQSLNGASVEQIFEQHLANTHATNPLNRMLYVDTKLWLPDDLLARGDKMSMAASLEARVPLLDHKLVEFAAHLPPSLKIKWLTRKYLLKKVSQKWLPAEIIQRKKQGFPVPLSLWFREEARDFVTDILSSNSLQQRGLFNPDYVNRLLEEHFLGAADHGFLLWGLLNVELWHRIFIDQPIAERVP